MNRVACAVACVVSIGLSSTGVWADGGGFSGLPLGLDIPNTSPVDYGYVRIADDDALESQTLTIEAWIHPLGNGYGRTYEFGSTIIGKFIEGGMGGDLGSWSMMWAPPNAPNDGKIYVAVVHQLNSSGTGLWSIGTVPMNSSAHVAMTFDGSWLRIFINGMLDNETLANDSNVDYGNQDVLIGAANLASPWLYRYDGIVDEVRIWDHARDETEIAAQMDCPLFGDETGLLA